MPGMPRIPGKTTKIAYKILGTPPNMRDTKVTEQGAIVPKKLGMGMTEELRDQLMFEDTSRIR